MKTIAEEAGTIPRIRDLDVSVAGIQSGRVSKESQFIFRYADADLPPTAAVSLAMPVRLASYNDGALHPPFAANLPEGWLLDHLPGAVRTRDQRQFLARIVQALHHQPVAIVVLRILRRL